MADTPQPWTLHEDVTADFVYLRLHASSAPPAAARRDVCRSLDNSDKRHAPDRARELMALRRLPG